MRHIIYAYEYDIETGSVSNRREFFNSSAYGPIPDGGVVLQLSPSGEVKQVIEMPVRCPASCMFFGPDLDRLFVPSIDPTFMGRPDNDQAGRNFVIDGLGVTGLPEPRYAG